MTDIATLGLKIDSSGVVKATDRLSGLERQGSRTEGVARSLSAAIAGVVSIATIKKLSDYADTFTEIQNRLKLVTDSSEELAIVNERLLSISQDTRSSLEGTVDLYSRLARSTDELGISSDRLFAVTESVNQAIAVSGTSAASAQAALFQLGQGLGAGALRGEELNSVLEQTPRLARAIADGLGVSISGLRELGAEGELTSERVISALENQSSVIAKEFSATSSTVSQAFIKINNELLTYIGNADKSIGATESVTTALNGVADNFEEVADSITNVVVPAITALAAVYAGRLASSITTATTARAASVVAIVNESTAMKASLATAVQETAIKARQSAAELQQAKNRTANAVAIKAQTGNTTLLTAALTAEARANQANIAATTAATAAKARYTAATNLATAASSRFAAALAIVGGPVGAAVIAAGAMGVYAYNLDVAELKTKETISTVDKLALSLKELGRLFTGTADTVLISNLADGFAKNTEERIVELIASANTRLATFKAKQASEGGFFGRSFEDGIKQTSLELKALEIALQRVKKASTPSGSGSDSSQPVLNLPSSKDKDLENFEKSIQRTIDSYNEQADAVGLSRAEAIRYAAAVKALSVDNETLANSLVSAAEGYAQALEKQEELTEEQRIAEEQSAALKAQHEKLTDSITEGLEDAILGYESLGDVAISVLNEIASAVIKQNITNPLSESIAGFAQSSSSSGFLSSVGDFFGGLFSMNASGGVVNTPTAVGMQGSQVGIAGEAGPEAILPLKRGSNGDLGVQVQNGSSSGSNVYVNINNQTGGETQVNETQGASGERIINVTVLKAVKDAIGSGSLDRDFRTNYGIQRKGT